MPPILVNLNEFVTVRMEDHESDPKSHVYEQHKLPGHEIDFANVEILDHANTIKKLEMKNGHHFIEILPNLEIDDI